MNARRLGLGISLLLVLGAAAAARAQPAPRIPLKDFFDNPKISSTAISPDGRQLVAAQGMLRHAGVAVTAAHYVEIKQRPVLGFGHLLKSDRTIIPIDARTA